ncbi:pentatricopeptide repeat-containing protein [Tanacetum coccineum]
MFIEFVIQNRFFSYSLEEFALILDVPCEGACVFTDRWRLAELAYGIPSDGLYQTNLPFIKDIISSIRIDRDDQVRRIHHEEEIDVLEYQVLTREIEPTLKPLEEIIQENVFCLGGLNEGNSYCEKEKTMEKLISEVMEFNGLRSGRSMTYAKSVKDSSFFDVMSAQFTHMIDLLAEISQSPRILSEVDAALKAKQMKTDTRPQGTSFLSDLKQKLLLSPSEAARAGTRYNVPLMNSLVLYVGMQAIQQLQARTPHGQSMASNASLAIFLVGAALDIFQTLIFEMMF